MKKQNCVFVLSRIPDDDERPDGARYAAYRSWSLQRRKRRACAIAWIVAWTLAGCVIAYGVLGASGVL
jgi:hypothetical protein